MGQKIHKFDYFPHSDFLIIVATTENYKQISRNSKGKKDQVPTFLHKV